MKQKYLTLLLIFTSAIINAQTQNFIPSTCIGTTDTRPENRMYNPHLVDINGDGNIDIITIVENSDIKLYKNNGDNTYTTSTILSNIGWVELEFSDLDNDGDLDIVTTSGRIYTNNGLGVFTQVIGTFFTASGNIGAVRVADFNGDGKPDILWLNSNTNSLSMNQIWTNTSSGSTISFTLNSEFDNLNIYANSGSVVGDFDGDGYNDLIICSTGGWTGRAYKNDGSGNMTLSRIFNTYTGKGFLIDWDKDGDLDFLAHDIYNNHGLRLWRNDGTGNFSTSNEYILPEDEPGFRVSEIVDLNGDSWPDVISYNSLYIKIYLNSGCRLILVSTLSANCFGSTKTGDLNNDGKPDLFSAARDWHSCIHLNNLETLNFVSITSPTTQTTINYNVGQTATQLSATGNNIKWYTSATQTQGSTTAPTPSTNVPGVYKFWVTNTNSNECESAKVEITVNVNDYANSLDFDGVNDHITIPPQAINNLPKGTIECWVNFNSLTPQTICAKQNNNINTYSVLGIGLGDHITTAAPGKVFYKSKNGNAIVSNTTLTTEQWYHIAVTFTPNEAKIYINGVLDNTKTGDFSLPNDTTVTATSIGAWLGDGNGKYLNGKLDEFRVWNTNLSELDIVNTMNCELQTIQNNIVTYYKFNHGFDTANNATFTTVNNETANENFGTLVNFELNGNSSNWLAGSPITSGVICTTLSQNEINLASIQLFPNPTKGVLNIKSNEDISIVIFDTLGKVIKKQNINSGETIIDLYNVTAGIYILETKNKKGESKNFKFIKH